ncbi:uncharacterized protein B0T15DRAFT_500251 [Chaetomium strumarium]|uniref:NmrA-like domain-containing protein n=1 Tax=Chaetomium strumarium TaxID=1170767 RepID=A0AAJ0GYF6_9PEZI|nr:hypothetical protein B0T15DRAFT_500251 [Chaetomium strumarium]
MSSPAQQSVLVIGAGELGSAILRALATHPLHSPQHTRLSVLRRAESIAKLSPPPPHSSSDSSSSSSSSSSPSPPTTIITTTDNGVRVALEAGDFVSAPVSELAATFARYDVVIQAAGFGAPRGTLLRVAEAAVAAGVARFFPWQFGVDYDAVMAAEGSGSGSESGQKELFGEMLAVRRLLRGQSRTRWTVVSTGLFMSFLFLKGFGVVDFDFGGERVLRALGGWENRVTVTEVEGIGRMVADIVYSPGDTESKVVYIAGDTVSYGDIADIMEWVYGKGFRREVWDMEYLKRRLEEEPGNVMLRYQNVFGAGVGISWEMEGTLNAQRGIRLMNLREYVEENKDRLADETN